MIPGLVDAPAILGEGLGAKGIGSGPGAATQVAVLTLAALSAQVIPDCASEKHCFRNRLAKWLRRKDPLGYDGVARATMRWEPYAAVVCFHMLLEGLCESGELK